MNTHLRALIAELHAQGWEYQPVQTNGSNHFVHPQFGKIVVASTPADWEDECVYTRQRARKAERRSLTLTASTQLSEENTEHSTPMQEWFAKIASLEAELQIVQEQAPAFWNEVRTLLFGWQEKLVQERKDWLFYLGKEICNPKHKRKQKMLLEDICLLVAKSTQDLYGINIDKEYPYLEMIRQERVNVVAEDQLDSLTDYSDFDADAWDQWFDEQDLTTYKPKEAQQGPRKKQATKPTTEANATAPTGKKIYLQLARELHPDKTTDENERIHRTHLMQQLNAAYAKNDMRTLLSLLKQHGQFSANDVDATILHTLQQQAQTLESTLRAAWKALPEIGTDWKSLLTQDHRKEQFLREQRRIAETQFRNLQAVRKQWQNPRELEELLRRSDIEDWYGLLQ